MVLVVSTLKLSTKRKLYKSTVTKTLKEIDRATKFSIEAVTRE